MVNVLVVLVGTDIGAPHSSSEQAAQVALMQPDSLQDAVDVLS